MIHNNILALVFADRRLNCRLMYEGRDVEPDRQWLLDIVCDTDSDDGSDIADEDEHIKQMLSDHVMEQKLRTQYYQNHKVRSVGCAIRCS